MTTVRRSNQRGHADRGWLKSFHSFSFGDYYDPKNMGFRTLRVINEDWVKGGTGFGTHPHRDMEIVTYVLSGALAHQDSMGNASEIRPGDVQRMTAGSGVTHSEVNRSESETVHLLQIWLLPEAKGLTPSYEQKNFPAEEKQGRLRLVASRDGRDGAVTIHQDAELYSSLLEPGQSVTHSLAPGRHSWVQLIRGAVTVNGEALQAGDAAAVSNEGQVEIVGTEAAELLLFDLA
ncbi:MAG: pirin family protein [Actinomycetota bacterium]